MTVLRPWYCLIFVIPRKHMWLEPSCLCEGWCNGHHKCGWGAQGNVGGWGAAAALPASHSSHGSPLPDSPQAPPCRPRRSFLKPFQPLWKPAPTLNIRAYVFLRELLFCSSQHINMFCFTPEQTCGQIAGSIYENMAWFIPWKMASREAEDKAWFDQKHRECQGRSAAFSEDLKTNNAAASKQRFCQSRLIFIGLQERTAWNS